MLGLWQHGIIYRNNDDGMSKTVLGHKALYSIPIFSLEKELQISVCFANEEGCCEKLIQSKDSTMSLPVIHSKFNAGQIFFVCKQSKFCTQKLCTKCTHILHHGMQ